MVLYSVNFVYLVTKLSLALMYTPSIRQVKNFKVSVIIPSFNEDEQSVVKAVMTLLKQTYPIHEIIFIDDGSDSEEAYLAVKNLKIDELDGVHFANKNVKLTSLRLDKNSGKKKAQEVGFIQATGDLFLLVDSDGEITENTLEEMIRPFSNAKVGSVVGKIEVRNLTDSFWTRLQDIIYSNSFQIGRASQSKTGNVIVCSGALSMHRANFVKRNMRTFRKETFLGIPCSAGDDRLLTDISLERRYKTVYQSTAVCYTDVPNTLRKFFKQQVRWTKSALIMTLFSFRYCFIRPLSMVWQVLETYLWLYNFIVTITLLWQHKLGLGVEVTSVAVIYFILVGYLSNIFYTKRSLKNYLITFVYSFVYSVLLLGIRFYSLLTIFKTGWSTR
ncbi:glycosyltransferase [Enterococcus sp. DIV0869a]|uniref:Hyaluronan synthase n=1 Tax=Candidatus Enterococcus ikei TaxID=2815326 RepID=A0ABS3GXX0_9ENTE|nr:glycosyltransferase [Enterococcus sp. DIV0869a]